MNIPGLIVQFRKYGLRLILAWTCILAAMSLFIINEYREDTIKEATSEAKDYHDLNLQYRRWSAKIGGVYAPIDKVTPNPYLTVPDRDVKTESGESLTLINPAYMTRMVFEAIRKESQHPVISRLVSLKPLNPANTPNAWEQETLKLFEKTKTRERFQILTIGGSPFLQYMAPFITEESCLTCHAHQGYKIGDVRGGMSIAIPMSGYLAIEAERRNSLLGGFTLLWFLGSAGIIVSSIRRHRQEMVLREHTMELEAEVSERQQIQAQLEEQTAMLEEEVTERQQAAVALRESEERFRGITESMADWIWEVDRNGRFTFSSESVERVLGYRPDEIVGKTVYDFFDPQDVDKIREALCEHTRNKTPIKNLENWNITKDGRRVCLMTNGVPILDFHGELTGYRGVDSDVTEQRVLERQVLQQQKLESIGLLAGGIAHDFNNMLVPIFGYAEMINARHFSDEKTAGYSATILKAAEKAKDLVSRLLSFSRQQTFRVDIQDLNEIITKLMVIMQRTIRENIEIKLHLSTEPCMVLADINQIEQVLLNLAVNAQDAINGTGTITIETGHLFFDHEHCLRHPGTIPGRHVMIAFSDTGCGIDEATLPYIFDPFFTTKPIGHGTGLGLSTIFGVVKQHSGSIDVSSRKGKGTTFKLFFPEKTGKDDIQEKLTVAKASDNLVGTILVVEDNPMVLNMVREILEEAGHRVITAEGPFQALDAVLSRVGNIDLLVSDVVMPQMNGPELFERINEQMPGLRVLYISGYAGGVITAHKGHLEEEANYISKPFTTEAFLIKVTEVMAGN